VTGVQTCALPIFQKFFDVFTERKIFSRKLEVKPLLYTA
jgi:NitT/TauT family transport system substrate-binding protein